MVKKMDDPFDSLQSSAIFLQGLQRYEVLEQIGAGGMGKVYKAFDKQLKRSVALKVAIGDMDGKNAVRFLREVEAMAQLQHPNIVSLYEIGQIQNHPFFSMELIEGHCLRDMLKKKKKLPAKQSAEIMLKIVLAMEYAHKKNVVHRDLKPENIMIRENGEPVIMDFGIAKIASSHTRLTKTGASLGTLSYMSPEQANGISSEIDHRSDVYSLGCILYEMLAGRTPFVVANQTELLMKIFEEMPPRLSQYKIRVSPAIEAICLKALHKEKNAR